MLKPADRFSPSPIAETEPETFSKEDLIQAIAAYRNKPEPEPEPEPRQHPVLYPDFWFILLALVANLTMTSSFTIFNLTMEHLVFIAIFALIVAMISNLTRDEEMILRIPSKPAQKVNWSTVQRRHGVTPVVRFPNT